MKTFKIESININSDHILMDGVGRFQDMSFEVEVVKSSKWIDSRMVGVIYVDVFKSWMLGNDDAFDSNKSKMFYNM